MEQHITYIGLDVHKDTITVTMAVVGQTERSARVWQDREYSGCIEDIYCKVSAWRRIEVLL